MKNIPRIAYGLGTRNYKGYNHNIDGTPIQEELVECCKNALKSGFKHLDLAEMYGNDREAGVAIKEYLQHNKRESIFITSKNFQTMDRIVEGCRESLKRLNCEYLDLYLLHSPVAFRNRAENSNLDIKSVWLEMEKCVDLGLVKRIGISNFRKSDMEELLNLKLTPPFINQVEWNPYLQQPHFLDFSEKHKILVSAYAPLAPLNLFPGGPVDEVVKNLASKYKTTETAILIRYTQQKNIIVITTSTKTSRMEECVNASVQSESDHENGKIYLTKEEIQSIDNEGKKRSERKYWDKDIPTGSFDLGDI